MNDFSFYITLPSSAGGTFFHNQPSNYKVHLSKQLELTDDWEVALTEITYPLNWRNVNSSCTLFFGYKRKDEKGYKGSLYSSITDEQKKQFVFEVLRDPTVKIAAGSTLAVEEITLPSAYYKNPQDLMNRIEEKFLLTMEAQKQKKEQYEPEPKLYLENKKDFKEIEFLGPIALGVGAGAEWQTLFNFKDARKGKVENFLYVTAPLKTNPLKFPEQIDSIYIYTSIIEPNLVGDAHVPLLRTVPVTGQYGDIVNETFIKPYYLAVKPGYIRDIEIQLTSKTGKDIEFQGGEVICVLHFRRKWSSSM